MTLHADNIMEALQQAVSHHQAGRVNEAEAIYNQVLTIKPDNEHANHFLGIIASQQGKNNLAVQFISKAIETNPAEPSYLINLGNVLINLQRPADAATSYQKALAIKPDYPEALYNLGNALRQLDRFDEAAASFQKAIDLKPDYAKAHNGMGVALREQGRPDAAVASYRQAINIDPEYASAYCNLGNVYKDLNDTKQAVKCYQRAVDIKPDYVDALNNLGLALSLSGRLDEALAMCRKSLAIEPDNAGTYCNLGMVYCAQVNMEEAVASFRKALTIKPDFALAHSNLISLMNYLPHVTQEDIYNEARQWDIRQASSLLPTGWVHDNISNKNRKLRIGYVSPDFRDHSVSFFFEPVLKAHDRDHFQIYLYSNVAKPDLVTERLQAEADGWLSIYGINDEDAAELIRQDRIDILVDLAKHTANNRLLVFAYKPAPVQVTWSGSPNTTGMQAIDYRFVDALASPAGMEDELNSEELIRLQHGSFCFQPVVDAPDVGASPVLKTGHITFGSFNNLLKINAGVIAVWAEILHKVADSRLLIIGREFAQESVRQRFKDSFAGHGIAAHRLETIPSMPKAEFLVMHGRIDIALDPFPYNGHTTTCYSLWMGVPVVTMLGNRHTGRVGASIMHHIGLQELVSGSTEEYLQLAQSLANDRDRLVTLRIRLRSRMQSSRFMDKELCTRSLEDAYLRIWTKWCRDQGQSA